MNSNKKQQNPGSGPVIFNLNFDDEISSSVFSKLVAGVIQHILYHREQIPEPFEKLLKVNAPSASTPNRVKDVHSHIKDIKCGHFIKTLMHLFENLDKVFAATDNNKVRRIAVLLGPTLLTPKEIHCIEIPEELATKTIPPMKSISSERYMTQLFRTLFVTHHSMPWPAIHPTNIIVMAEMKRNCGIDWFLPKGFYTLPEHGHCAVYNLILSRALSNGHSVWKVPDVSQHQVSVRGDNTAKRQFCVYQNHHWPVSSETKEAFTHIQDSIVSVDTRMKNLCVDDRKIADHEDFIWYQMPVTLKGIV